MAYQRSNYLKKAAHIISVYKAIKESDKPDTRIVSQEFPKHGIFIGYRQWMNIKGMKPSEYAPNQLNLFAS